MRKSKQKTKIDWADYAHNPVKGICRHKCEYCYAKRMYNRFKWDKKIRLDLDELSYVGLPEPQKIFIGSMHDIFGEWITHDWVTRIIKSIYEDNKAREILGWPLNNFIFLTKNPKRYAEFIFPKNCWLGTTVEDNKHLGRLYDLFLATKNREFAYMNKRFVSFEPLLDNLRDLSAYEEEIINMDWIIIGGLTPKPVHDPAWVKRILDVAHWNKIPVFLKKNLQYPEERKDYPKWS